MTTPVLLMVGWWSCFFDVYMVSVEMLFILFYFKFCWGWFSFFFRWFPESGELWWSNPLNIECWDVHYLTREKTCKQVFVYPTAVMRMMLIIVYWVQVILTKEKHSHAKPPQTSNLLSAVGSCCHLQLLRLLKLSHKKTTISAFESFAMWEKRD